MKLIISLIFLKGVGVSRTSPLLSSSSAHGMYRVVIFWEDLDFISYYKIYSKVALSMLKMSSVDGCIL